jgi:hypothetical protein
MGCKRCVGEHRSGEPCPVALAPVPGDSLEGQRHGPLLLKRRLEVGAVASVYLAEYVPTGHRFTVKVLHAHLASRPAVRARFIAEALAQRNVVHRHVARVLDVRPGPQGLPCVLMEAPEGESLSGMPLPLSSEEVGEVLDQALAGLEAAHTRGLVHGDLTLDSLFVTRDAKGERRVRVRDFGAGVVREAALSSEERGRGVTVGSPTFMAPEQCAGSLGGPRADIHAMGVAGYLLVTGRLPFGLGRSANVSLFPPHAVNASVPPALSTVLLRAMAARPEDRFDSAWAFRAALAEALGREVPVRDASADAPEVVSDEWVTEEASVGAASGTMERAVPVGATSATTGHGTTVERGVPTGVTSTTSGYGTTVERGVPAGATSTTSGYGTTVERGVPAGATSTTMGHGTTVERGVPTGTTTGHGVTVNPDALATGAVGLGGPEARATVRHVPAVGATGLHALSVGTDDADDIDIVEDVPAWGGGADSVEHAALRALDGGAHPSHSGDASMRADVAAFWASAVALLGTAEPELPADMRTPAIADGAVASESATPGAPILLTQPASPILLVDPASPLDVAPQAPVSLSSTLGAAAIPYMTLAPVLESAPIPLTTPAPIPLVDIVAPLEASAPRTDAPRDLRVRLGLTSGEALQLVSVSDVAPEGLFAECQGSLPALAARLPVEVSFRGETALGACDVVRHVTFDEARTWNVPAGVFVHFADEYPALGRLLSRALLEDSEPAPDAELARLLSRAEAVARDPYTLLGAKPDAAFADIHRRAQAALRRLNAFNPRPLPTQQRQALQSLRVRVLAAQRMLGDPLSRVGFDATRGNLGGLARCVAAGVPEPTLEALRSAFLAARPEVETQARALFTQGHALEVQRAVPAALERYAEALKLDPLNTSWLKHYQALLHRSPAAAVARETGAMA